MKKLSFFLMAMLISLVSFAQDAPIYELVPATGSNNSYAGNCDITIDGIKWNLTGNSTMQPWRIGGKSITNQDRALYSKTPLAYNIDKIEVTHGTANSITVNSFKLIISDEANGAGETIDVAFKASATTTIDLPEGDYTNKYFKFLYNVTNSTSNNKYVQFTGAKFYAALAEDAVKAPIIKGAEDFISETEVTIEAEDDVTVYYTLDGTEPTTTSTIYAAPFTVKETTTVKAVAYRGETASFVTSATFTQATRVTAAEAAELAMKVASNNALTSVTYVINAYVTSVIDQTLSSGQQRFWVADTKDGGQVLQSYYCNVPQVLKVGDYIQMFGKLTKYNTSPQMKNGDVTILEEPAPEPVMYTVTVTAENGTVEGAGEYEEGTEATLTATANEGYEFICWTVGEDTVSTENPYTFAVTADIALVANFKEVVIEEDPNKVPTNAELWEAFKPYYNTYYGLARADQPIDKVSTFAAAKMQEIMTDAKSEYKWLGDYVLNVAAGQGLNLPTDMAAANEGGWRWAVHAFFNATTGANGAAGTDFTEAGKPQAWGPAYLAAQKPAEPTTETVYFINAKKWAKVNVYAWTTDPNASWPGAAATKEAEQIAGYDVYSFTANAGQYANVIFNDGSSQTPDLVWTAGKYYVIDMGWLTKEEAESKLAAPLPETWNVVGDAGLMGSGWDLNDAKNAMTLQADGTYLLEKKDITITAGSYEYKAAKDHGWTVAIPQDGNQKLTISKSGIYDITFVLNVTAKTLKATATLKKEAVVIPTVVIAGDMNSWNQTKDKFTMSADSLTATFKTTLAVKNYGFKMIVGGAWHSDGKTVTRAANSTKFTGANSNTNSTLKADIAGEYLFTWEYATKTLTVTYPALPVKYNVTVTAENGTVTGAGEYEEGKTATLTATAAEGYEFVNWTVGEEVVSTENPYTFTVSADAAFVANFKEVVVEPTYDWDVEAKDLYVNANEVMTQIEGSNSFNPDMMISVTLFATGYGKYTSAGTDNDQFNAYYMGYPILGELTYSYSEELKSDLVVIIGTMTDEENITSTVRITMYEEYLEPTDVVVLNNLMRTPMGSGMWASLMLHTALQDTIITISGCDGTYGKYNAFATFGALELDGKGEWKNDGENDVFVGVLYNADKTKVFHVTASTPAEAAPEAKEYRFEASDVTYEVDLEGNLIIECESGDEAAEPFYMYIFLAGWNGAGSYEAGEMYGSIATMDNPEGADVANMNSEIEVIVEDGKVIIIGQVEDADGNIYNLSLEGAEPQVDDDDPTTGVENLNGTVAPVKVIENGQIFIIRNGLKYNAQGAKL